MYKMRRYGQLAFFVKEEGTTMVPGKWKGAASKSAVCPPTLAGEEEYL